MGKRSRGDPNESDSKSKSKNKQNGSSGSSSSSSSKYSSATSSGTSSATSSAPNLTITKLESIDYAMVNLAKSFQTLLDCCSDLIHSDSESYSETVKSYVNKPRFSLAKSIKLAYENDKLPLIDKIIDLGGAKGGITDNSNASIPKDLFFSLTADSNVATKNKKPKLTADRETKSPSPASSNVWPPQLPEIHNKQLEQQVFTHKSMNNDKQHLSTDEKVHMNNERLEFLGDSVLNFVSTNIVYEFFPNVTEGDLTVIRSLLVCNDTVSQWAKLYELDKRLESKVHEAWNSDASKNSKMIADVFEAYIGGLYLDQSQGPSVVQKWLEDLFGPTLATVNKGKSNLDFVNQDAKQLLYVQIGSHELYPRYVTVMEPTSSIAEFSVECQMGDEVIGVGKGKNIKTAGLRAAMMALGNLPAIEKYSERRRKTARGKSKEIIEVDEGKVAHVQPASSSYSAPSSQKSANNVFKDILYAKIGTNDMHPVYETIHRGASFYSTVKMGDRTIGKGIGNTKQDAEQKAAQTALEDAQRLSRWVDAKKG